MHFLNFFFLFKNCQVYMHKKPGRYTVLKIVLLHCKDGKYALKTWHKVSCSLQFQTTFNDPTRFAKKPQGCGNKMMSRYIW